MSGINLNSPLNLGDKFPVSGLISNGEDIKNYKVGYEIPLMSNGLKAQTSYSRTDYDLVKMGQTTPDGIYDGNTSTVEVGISYPIIRTRMENLNFTTVYSNKELKDYYDEALNKNREINSVKLGLDYTKNHTLLGFDSNCKIETFYTLGKLDIKDKDSNDQDKAGVNNQGTYSKVNVSLGTDIQFTPTYSLNTNVKTQYALNNKNLDGSETLGKRKLRNKQEYLARVLNELNINHHINYKLISDEIQERCIESSPKYLDLLKHDTKQTISLIDVFLQIINMRNSLHSNGSASKDIIAFDIGKLHFNEVKKDEQFSSMAMHQLIALMVISTYTIEIIVEKLSEVKKINNVSVPEVIIDKYVEEKRKFVEQQTDSN
jgi:hypothetical protein